MGKVSVIIYITLFSLLLLLFCHSPTERPTHRHRRLRLRLRSNSTFTAPLHRQHDHHIPFDPLVADIELRREDKEWEKKYIELAAHSNGDSAPHPEWKGLENAEDYVNDGERFNVTDRLVLLFPKIDVDPADGFVSVEELTEWNLQQAERETMHRTERELQTQDKNHDGFVSFAEYEPPSWVQAAGNSSFGYDIIWWKEEHFNAADADGDGLLNLTEYNDFLHPANSKSPKLLRWLCADVLWERDIDKDGKLDFPEFLDGLFDLVRSNDEDNSSWHREDIPTEVPAKELFSELDKDNDGHLSVAELLPIIGKIHPSELYYAKQQARYTIFQADIDKDGRLSLTEMINNPFVFYNAVFNEDEDENEDDYWYHDEFR